MSTGTGPYQPFPLGIRSSPSNPPPDYKPSVSPTRIEIKLDTVDKKTTVKGQQHLTKPVVVPPEPAPQPMSIHVVSHKPITTFKREIEGDSKTQEAALKAHEQNLTNIKMKKIACAVLLGVTAVFLIAGLAAACAFCPPLGVAILVVGITGAACGVVVGGVKLATAVPNRTHEELGEIQRNKEKLDAALKLFEQHPYNQDNPDGTSFEEFINSCPAHQNDSVKGAVYKLADLDKYVELFKKKQEIRAIDQQQKTLQEAIDQQAQILLQLGVEEPISKESCEKKVQELQQEKPESNDKVDKQLSAAEAETRKESIAQIETALATLQEKQTAFDALSPERQKMEQELSDAKEALRVEIEAGTVPAYQGPDERKGSPGLAAWMGTNPQVKETTVEVNKESGAIYLFGAYNTAPRHGVRDPQKGLAGVALKLSAKELEQLGRSDKMGFLSNAYAQNLMVDGKQYRSVTHYMLMKRIDKAILKLTEGQTIKRRRLDTLKQDVIKEQSVAKACDLVNREILSRAPLFDDMDEDLKTALYSKFVGPDGKLSKEGKLLVGTGKAPLYAGYELGDPSYGMQFSKKGEMIGENKLGRYLEELRDLLKDASYN